MNTLKIQKEIDKLGEFPNLEELDKFFEKMREEETLECYSGHQPVLIGENTYYGQEYFNCIIIRGNVNGIEWDFRIEK